MKKAYLFAPLVAILVFGGIYWNFQSGYKEREKAREDQAALARQTKLKAEVEARRVAIEDAVKSQELRKKERELKEAVDKAEREARQVALDARDQAFREQDKVAKQIERQKKDLAIEKDAVAKIEESKKSGLAEQAFLAAYVTKTEANATALADLLVKIDAAEAARISAAAADLSKKKS